MAFQLRLSPPSSSGSAWRLYSETCYHPWGCTASLLSLSLCPWIHGWPPSGWSSQAVQQGPSVPTALQLLQTFVVTYSSARSQPSAEIDRILQAGGLCSTVSRCMSNCCYKWQPQTHREVMSRRCIHQTSVASLWPCWPLHSPCLCTSFQPPLLPSASPTLPNGFQVASSHFSVLPCHYDV